MQGKNRKREGKGIYDRKLNEPFPVPPWVLHRRIHIPLTGLDAFRAPAVPALKDSVRSSYCAPNPNRFRSTQACVQRHIRTLRYLNLKGVLTSQCPLISNANSLIQSQRPTYF